MTRKVESFEYGWNPKLNKGAVRISFSSGQTAHIPVASLGELAGWAALFARAPLLVGDGGWIHTGSETIGQAFSGGTEVPFPF